MNYELAISDITINTSSAANLRTAVKGVFSGTLSLGGRRERGIMVPKSKDRTCLHFVGEFGVRGQGDFEGDFSSSPIDHIIIVNESMANDTKLLITTHMLLGEFYLGLYEPTSTGLVGWVGQECPHDRIFPVLACKQRFFRRFEQ